MTKDEALRAAESPDCDQRVEAAQELSRHVGDSVADGALARLLADDNLAVIEAAGDALLRQRNQQAATLFLTAYAAADDEAGDYMNDLIDPLWRGEGVPVVDLCRAVLRDGNAQAQAGAAELLRWLGVEGA